MNVRLLPWSQAGGAYHMAADETLLLSAQAGVPSLRFYTWTEATVSLGYFQTADSRLDNPLLAALPWVRRPTGGATLVHHHELTYALAVPAPLLRDPGPLWMRRVHEVYARTLVAQGIQVELCGGESATLDDNLCFLQPTPGDLLVGRAKILGSAQRKQKHCLLQHGALLLARSEFTPQLPGIRELAGRVLCAKDVADAILEEFKTCCGWRFDAADWTASEQRQIVDLIDAKYARRSWNAKR